MIFPKYLVAEAAGGRPIPRMIATRTEACDWPGRKQRAAHLPRRCNIGTDVCPFAEHFGISFDQEGPQASAGGCATMSRPGTQRTLLGRGSCTSNELICEHSSPAVSRANASRSHVRPVPRAYTWFATVASRRLTGRTVWQE